jgi:hypothetical protein
LKVNQSATLIADTASLCHFSNNFFYVRGGSAGLSIGDDGFSNSITLTDNADIAFEAGSALRMRILASGNVGIGTSSPTAKLHVSDSGAVGVNVTSSASQAFMNFTSVNTAGFEPFIGFGGTSAGDQAQMIGVVNGGVRWTVAGSERMRLTANGLTFNGDTAAANALDDYEEGTWTMGVSFGGASVGVTSSTNTGTYTKIGRQVTVNGYIQLTSKGSSTGTATITGLPFTIPNNFANVSAASLVFISISFANQFMGSGTENSTTIGLFEITEAGVLTVLNDANFSNNSGIIVSLTYFV